MLLNTKFDDVAKSSASLNNTLPFNPGGAAVIVAIFPDVTPLTKGVAIAVKEFPLKSI